MSVGSNISLEARNDLGEASLATYLSYFICILLPLKVIDTNIDYAISFDSTNVKS